LKISKAQTHSYRQINNHNERLGREWSPFLMATKMLEEAGEVASDILGLEGIKPKGDFTKEMLGRELSDLLYNIFIIAETYDIDLESVYIDTIDKYEDHLFTK
jgi:NTP pyrophosphatase (non-canonical NTP hydrolase)